MVEVRSPTGHHYLESTNLRYLEGCNNNRSTAAVLLHLRWLQRGSKAISTLDARKNDLGLEDQESLSSRHDLAASLQGTAKQQM